MNDKLLNESRVGDKTSMSRVTRWRKIKAGKFPKPVKIDGRNYWKESTINQYIEEMTA